jgi:hypothetical protein
MDYNGFRMTERLSNPRLEAEGFSKLVPVKAAPT